MESEAFKTLCQEFGLKFYEDEDSIHIKSLFKLLDMSNIGLLFFVPFGGLIIYGGIIVNEFAGMIIGLIGLFLTVFSILAIYFSQTNFVKIQDNNIIFQCNFSRGKFVIDPKDRLITTLEMRDSYNNTSMQTFSFNHSDIIYKRQGRDYRILTLSQSGKNNHMIKKLTRLFLNKIRSKISSQKK